MVLWLVGFTSAKILSCLVDVGLLVVNCKSSNDKYKGYLNVF